MEVYAYVYKELFIFPSSNIEYETITTNKFFLDTHQLIKGKAHLHHSHITGQIIGYTHDFCNTRVIDKSNTDIPFIPFILFMLHLRGALKKLMMVEIILRMLILAVLKMK